MEEKKNRSYDRQYKEEAVHLVIDGKRPVAEVARGLGIHENLLRIWKRKYKEDPFGSFPGKGKLSPQDEKLKRLQKDNANLKEEREILKKALAIFSKHPR